MLALIALFALASLPAANADSNPFDVSGGFYVNPSYQAELSESIATATGTTQTNLEAMMDVSSAYWIDVKSKIEGNDTSTVQGILADAASAADPPLVVLIVYDLPNRDCDAKASNGEICCTYNEDLTCDYDTVSDCADGIAEYKTEYIDVLAAVLAEYDGVVPIALVIEPDSLPNLATNMGNSHCSNTATVTAYKTGATYAVQTLAASCPSCALYLDAAHGGWLGWEDNLASYVDTIVSLDVTDYLRGFATNVANYQSIGLQCNASVDCILGPGTDDACCADPCGLLDQWNYGNNEMNYATMLSAAFVSAVPGFTPHMIIDSGRNGVADMRSDCSDWCNIRNAGVGLLPTIETSNTSLVDAYAWLKTPGESDGCTQTLPSADDPFVGNGTCVRYDSMCASTDSIGSETGEPYAPEAGKWFDYQIKQLADNAVWAN